MIKIGGRKDYLVALESVAMTDIVMNLFIFFFISFSILYTFGPNNVSKLNINLPKAESAIQLEGSEKVVLAVSKSGEYFIDDKKVRAGALKAALGQAMKGRDDAGLLLKVDSDSRFDSVAKALDVVNELNITRVSVATVRKAN